MQSKKVIKLAETVLEDLKANDIEVIDVRGKSSVTDYMIVCSGTSKRHVVSIASNVEDELKNHSINAISCEGQKSGDWVIVDLSDVVIHILTVEARELYDLEKLWRFDMKPEQIIDASA